MAVEWIVFEIFINIVEVGTVFYLLCSKFPAKYRTFVPTLLFMAGTIGYLSLPLFVSDGLPPVEIIFFAICLLYVLLFRNGGLWKKIFWTSLAYALLMIISFSVVMALPTFFRWITANEIYQPSNIRLILNIIIRIIHITVFYLLALKKEDKALSYGLSLRICFIVPLISIFAMIFIYYMSLNYDIPEVLLYTIAIAYLLINIVIFAMYKNISREAEKNYILMAERKRYELMEQHNIQVMEIYGQMREWKHDFLNHMQVVLGMLEKEDSGRSGEAIDYIKNLGGKIESSSLGIATGNLVVDAIVSAKATLAAANDIRFEHHISLKDDIPIDKTDLCSILSNLIDNAIEGCCKMKENRYINLEMRVYQNHLIMEITNASSGEYKLESGELKTTKNGNLHGIGIGHVKTIVESYGGLFDVQPEEQNFTAYITIPLVSEIEKEK